MSAHSKETLNHPEADLVSLSQQVSQLLAEHPDTMLQVSAADIQKCIESGLGIIVTHPHHPQELAAFARLFQWPGTNQFGQAVYEFSSWVVPEKYQGQGFGGLMLQQMVAQGKDTFPGCQIIAVIERSNTKAQHILLQAGGMVLSPRAWPSNFQILLQEGQAQIVVMDITHI